MNINRIYIFALLAFLMGVSNLIKPMDSNSANTNVITDLFKSVEEGNIDAVIAILGQITNINEIRNSMGCTLLHKACNKGHFEIAKHLINNKADVNAKTNNGSTPLMMAARYDHKDIVKMLIEAKADVNAKDKYGDTPLIWAASNGHKDIIQMLIQAKTDVNAKDKVDNTPLNSAASNGHKDIVQMLIQAKTDVNAKNREGNTPLNDAALSGHIEIVKLLLNAGADKNIKNRDFNTPLAVAKGIGNAEIVKLLTTDMDKYNDSLLDAIDKGHSKIIAELIKAGADVNMQIGKDHVSLLSLAVMKGHSALVEELLKAGARTDLLSKNMESPLRIALRKKDKKLIDLILHYEPCPLKQDEAQLEKCLPVPIKDYFKKDRAKLAAALMETTSLDTDTLNLVTSYIFGQSKTDKDDAKFVAVEIEFMTEQDLQAHLTSILVNINKNITKQDLLQNEIECIEQRTETLIAGFQASQNDVNLLAMAGSSLIEVVNNEVNEMAKEIAGLRKQIEQLKKQQAELVELKQKIEHETAKRLKS